MLLSLVLQLRALQPARIAGSTGRGVHGFWFRHWQQVDPALADSLHQGEDVLPFTLSPLMGLPRPRLGVFEITLGQPAWFRATTLTQALSQATQEKWVTKLPDEIDIADTRWQVVKPVLSSPEQHPWAGQAAYSELASARLYTLHPPHIWRLEFLTPVAFHGTRGHFPFPLPNSLVASWLRRWQAYSPLALPDDLPERVRQEVVISAYQLKTVPVRHGQRLVVGCVGRLELRALGLHPAERAALDALAAYAFFAGSGQHTTQGMGLTRLIE